MAPRLSIVVVEDHDSLRLVTVDMLRQHGHDAVGLSCAEELDEYSGGANVDLFILDLNLPGEDGISLARRIRRSQPGAGIVMLTVRSALEDKLDGYEVGADSYLPKPVAPEELLAVINSLSRRLKPQPSDFNAETLYLDSRRLVLRGAAGEVSISSQTAALVSAFARAPAQRLEYWQIMELLGQDPETFSKSSLEVRIVRLRKQLQAVSDNPYPVKAIRLFGYQLCIAIHIF